MTVRSLRYSRSGWKCRNSWIPRPGHVPIGVVHHRRALEVAGRQHGPLEVQSPPAEPTLSVVIEPVDRAGEHDRGAGRDGAAHVEVVDVESYVDARGGRHRLQPGGVAVDRQTLVLVGEVAV